MTDNKPLIFVTNDDGVEALGFNVLIEEMLAFGNVIAIGPETGQSGMSHALTFSLPVRIKQLNDEENLKIYKINGTPVDCVKMGLDKILPRKPDLLVSGINHGSNSSISAIYSGTVAAAREGCLNSIPSIAFSSLDFSHDANFDYLRGHIHQITDDVLKNGISPGIFYNVNFPVQTEEEIKGIKICRQAKGVWVEEFEKRTDPMGKDYHWLTGYFKNYEPDAEDTDEWVLKHNWGSLVPLQTEVTAFDEIKKLRDKN